MYTCAYCRDYTGSYFRITTSSGSTMDVCSDCYDIVKEKK